jgi:hypothetical protein
MSKSKVDQESDAPRGIRYSAARALLQLDRRRQAAALDTNVTPILPDKHKYSCDHYQVVNGRGESRFAYCSCFICWALGRIASAHARFQAE